LNYTITSPSAETGGGGSDLTSGSSCVVQPYASIGPSAQSYGYGYGAGLYGGLCLSALQNDLDGALAADTAGNNGSGTQIRLTSTTGFPTTGTIAVGNELITYTNIAGNELTGISRGALGTTATTGTINGQAHSDGAVVTNATDFTGWGNAVEASTVTLEPGLWSLSNFGEVLVAPFAIVATNTSPKLLNDHRPGSSVTVDASTAFPHPVKSVAFVTTAPSLCA
jgi:hypothetical protein